MSVRNLDYLKDFINEYMADNKCRAITPEILRTSLLDIVDTLYLSNEKTFLPSTSLVPITGGAELGTIINNTGYIFEVLNFDQTVPETCYFSFVADSSFASTKNVVFTLTSLSETTGEITIDMQLLPITQTEILADAIPTITKTLTFGVVAGEIQRSVITFSANEHAISANDTVSVKITKSSGTTTSDFQLVNMSLNIVG
jgi:hypothetical protein